jgi:F-type H+-transporting ATPase subunit delta
VKNGEGRAASTPEESGPGSWAGTKGRRDSRIVAERYARATLSVALDKNADLDRITTELDDFRALLDRESRLSVVLASPAIPSETRTNILEDVLRLRTPAPETRNLLRVLTLNERMPLLGEVADSFRRLVLEQRQIQPGEVISAHPLTESQRTRLAESLGQALKRTMELTYRSDPALLGGVVVRIGNRVFDASVTTQLRRFKEKALSNL